MVSTPNPAPLDDGAIHGALQASRAAMAAGRTAEAEQLLVRLAQQAPGHPAVLNELGVLMMNRHNIERLRGHACRRHLET